MKVTKYVLPRVICWLIVIAAVTAIGITALVYSGSDDRDAVTSVAREFFVRVERASRARPAPVSAPASPAPEGGIIQ
jgi:hypothetical protein